MLRDIDFLLLFFIITCDFFFFFTGKIPQLEIVKRKFEKRKNSSYEILTVCNLIFLIMNKYKRIIYLDSRVNNCKYIPSTSLY